MKEKIFTKNVVITIISMFAFIILCIFCSIYFMDYVNKIDISVQSFFANHMITINNTNIMKVITNFGSEVAVLLTFVFCLFFFKDKLQKIILSSDLAFILFFSLSLKYTFNRERPKLSLIETPMTNSFPSGHTFFAVGFYGVIIYFIWKSKLSKVLKYLLTFIILELIIFIGISRIYLNVHYFTDVIGGLILGLFSVVIFTQIYNNLKEKK